MANLDLKDPTIAASTAALAVTKAEALILEGSASLVIDGEGVGVSDRVLLKDQSSAAQNGPYEATSSPTFGGGTTFGGTGEFAVGSSWTLTRTGDADTTEELAEGMTVPVEGGGTNRHTTWVLTTKGAITVGTTPQTYTALRTHPGGEAGGALGENYAEPRIAENAVDTDEIASGAVMADNLGPGVRDYGIVSSLPTSPSPVAGDICHYKAAEGIYWTLLYTGEAKYPWAKVGGAPLFAEVLAAETTESTSYVNLSTMGPSLTVPLSGDYDVEIGFIGVQLGGAGPIVSRMSYSVGAVGAADADRISQIVQPGTGNTNAARPRRKTDLGAATALVSKYNVSSGKGEFINRWMRIDPVRVG
jgi:hypothetical protein